MGKQTRIHPIPLSVLRGTLEYCGWAFDNLKQVGAEATPHTAFYKVTGLKPPSYAPRMDAQGVKLALQRCYMPTVQVQRVVTDSDGRIDAWLMVATKQKKVTVQEEEAAQADIPF